jgi:SAM-dependent methyltransferase
LMSHVLEHLVDVNAVIAEVARVLAPGGLLLIYVPNFKSFPARVLKNKWGFLVPHAHIWQFEPKPLRALVARASCGLLEMSWMRTSTLLEYTETGVWWKTLVKAVALRSAAAFSYGDEISAAFKKVEN